MAFILTAVQSNKQEIWVLKKAWTPSLQNVWLGGLHLTKMRDGHTAGIHKTLASQEDSSLDPSSLELKCYRNPALSFSAISNNCHGNSSTSKKRGRFSKTDAGNVVYKGQWYFTKLHDSAVVNITCFFIKQDTGSRKQISSRFIPIHVSHL